MCNCNTYGWHLLPTFTPLLAQFHTVYCLNMVLEVIQASQEITKMLAIGMAAYEVCRFFFMPQVDVFNMISHVGNTLELSHASGVR